MKKIRWFFLLPAILLSGCYNYHEINELSIATAIGIDKTEDGYKLIAQVMNVQKKESDTSSGGNVPEVIIYKNEGKSLLETLRYIILQSPKKLYPSHLDILLISEKVAKDGIEDIYEMFFRNPNIRMQFNVLVTKGASSEEILETLTPGQTVSAKNIVDSQEIDTKYLGTNLMVTFEDFMDMYLNPNREITLPSVILLNKSSDNNDIENIEKSNDNAKIVLNSTAIFKGDNLSYYISDADTIYLNYIKGNLNGSLITANCEDGGYLTVEVKNIKSGTSYDKVGKKMMISVQGEASINEMNCDIDINKESGIARIEKMVNKTLDKNISNFIKESKENYNIDFFDFLDVIYKNDYNYYKKIKDTWYDNGFRDLVVNVNSKIKVDKKGNVLRDAYGK